MKYEDIRQDRTVIDEYSSNDILILQCCSCEKNYQMTKRKVVRALKDNTMKNFCSGVCRGVETTKNKTTSCKCDNCEKQFVKPNSLVRKFNFCTSSCAATYNNKKRKHSAETKAKISKSLIGNQNGNRKKHTQKKPKKLKRKRVIQEIVGDYTKIYLCTCKFSNEKWYSATVKTVHPNLKVDRARYAYSCRFDFWIGHYNEWFLDEIELVHKHGWYTNPGSNKKGEKNLNGVSRDHMFSIHDGWAAQVSPDILRHPANCKLMQHKENQTKNTKSNITLEELKLRIDAFEEKYGKVY